MAAFDSEPLTLGSLLCSDFGPERPSKRTDAINTISAIATQGGNSLFPFIKGSNYRQCSGCIHLAGAASSSPKRSWRCRSPAAGRCKSVIGAFAAQSGGLGGFLTVDMTMPCRGGRVNVEDGRSANSCEQLRWLDSTPTQWYTRTWLSALLSAYSRSLASKSLLSTVSPTFTVSSS